ncbi:predicted protein [Botrytis cinerea T4]|uniref:Uncharacterized protein n=1 Tax=Botryotinia fuckeliana (strain T4) TaxID=999810 RepID=G2YFE6_BOTF4|nr:predicted protein [Botrytis cinerea T4]
MTTIVNLNMDYFHKEQDEATRLCLWKDESRWESLIFGVQVNKVCQYAMVMIRKTRIVIKIWMISDEFARR